MELPPSDAAADIRRTNVEREATYLEFARLEAAAKRRVAQRTCAFKTHAKKCVGMVWRRKAERKFDVYCFQP
jgi:hypothetical protein